MSTPVQLHAATAPVPPQNLEAEESVLGAMLMSEGAIAAVADVVQPTDFYRESHGRVYRAALAVHAAGEPVDAITVVDELEQRGDLEAAGGRQRIHELAALVPATANAGHYARIVREMAQLRRLIVVGGEIARLGWERPGDTDQLLEQARALAADVDTAGARDLTLESWATFERSAATETIPTIVDGLWAEGGFGFVAAPPKKGKTWIGLSLAIAVAAGKPFLHRFQVAKPRPVVYLALEGHRAALRGRIGALARGLDLNPDQGAHDLDNLHLLYKPRGINLNDPAWVRRIRATVESVNAGLVIVDVLRAAAVMKENSNDEFSQLRAALQPITDDGVAIALLHHFGKLTEISRERTPGERMSGAGAMYGALDVGVFITAADDGARTLRVEFETRDLAQPHELGVHLEGEMTGESGGFVYRDTATWIEQLPQERDDVKAPAEEIAAYVRDQGGAVERRIVEGYFGISDHTLARRLVRLRTLGVELVKGGGKGGPSRLVAAPEPEPDDQLSLSDASAEPIAVLPGQTSTSFLEPPSSNFEEWTDVEEQTAQPSGIAPHSGHSSTSSTSAPLRGNESAHMQGKDSSTSSTSPTERQPSADAKAATPEANADPEPEETEDDWALE